MSTFQLTFSAPLLTTDTDALNAPMSSSTTDAPPPVRTSRVGSVLHILLDRPRALNALNAEAVERLHDALEGAEKDENVACILIRGVGDRAFCAGGDVRAVHDMLARGDANRAVTFFTREFALNARLHALRKPSCCVWNGVVMGGGAGLSCYSPVRVATEKTTFAMPECQIGLYPDVGASWFLHELCGHATAVYLSLTGARVRGRECKSIGLATHYVELETWEREIVPKIEELGLEAGVEDLARVASSGETTTTTTTSEAVDSTTYATSAEGRRAIEEVFGDADMSLKDIRREMAQRAKNASDVEEKKFFVAAADAVDKASPTSLEVSLELMRRARGKSLDWCLAMDSILIAKFIACDDFRRGVNSMLIKKTGAPPPEGWCPLAPSDALEFFSKDSKL